MRVICVYFGNSNSEREAAITGFAECCYTLTPDIAFRKREALFLDIARCHRLYSERTAIGRLRVWLRRFGLEAKLSLADDVPTALALARMGEREGANSRSVAEDAGGRKRFELPLARLADYVDPFGRDLMADAAVLRMLEALEALGLRTLGDFAKLPPRDLVARSGAPAEIAWRRLRDRGGAQAIPWPRWKLPEKVRERAELLEHERCASLEPLLFKTRELTERAMGRLRGRGLRASRLRLAVEVEKLSILPSTKREWNFDFYVPQGAAQGVLAILRERLARELEREPLASPVESIALEILETAPGLAGQRNLFHERDEREEALRSLVGRVAEKLGATRVFQAETTERYVPELSWTRRQAVALVGAGAGGGTTGYVLPPRTKQPPTAKAAIANVAAASAPRSWVAPYGPRPLRLFSRPRSLHRVGRFLLEGGKRWRIVDVFGPERIRGEWWTEANVAPRDYYRIETENGDTLWIYRDGEGGLFLHGVFE